MYVCVYVRTYVYIYIYICSCTICIICIICIICVYTYIYIYVYMYVHISHTYIYMYMYVYIYIYIHVHRYIAARLIILCLSSTGNEKTARGRHTLAEVAPFGAQSVQPQTATTFRMLSRCPAAATRPPRLPAPLRPRRRHAHGQCFSKNDTY